MRKRIEPPGVKKGGSLFKLIESLEPPDTKKVSKRLKNRSAQYPRDLPDSGKNRNRRFS
jgi:hypothetical protein